MALISLDLSGFELAQHQADICCPCAGHVNRGFAIEGLPDASRMERLVCKITINPAMVVFFLQWPAPDRQQQAVFPDASPAAIWGHGAIPVLAWEHFYLTTL